jgi:hypothetical protein
LVSFVGAGAVQISAVPDTPLARERNCQVVPVAVTEVMVCRPAPLGPSELMKATRSSFGPEVEKVGLVAVGPELAWVLTTVSRPRLAAPAVDIVTARAAPVRATATIAINARRGPCNRAIRTEDPDSTIDVPSANPARTRDPAKINKETSYCQ